MNEIASATLGGQRPNQYRSGSDFTTPQTVKHPRLPIGKNRELILDQIATKWALRGLYTSPSRAMIALLEGVK